MFCSNCGSFIPDGSTYCPDCNAPVEAQAASDNKYNESTVNTNNTGDYYSPQQNYANTQQYNQPNTPPVYQQPNQQYNYNNAFHNAQQLVFEQEIRNALSTSKTLGILAIILGILVTPIAGIICGAIGLSKANSVVNISNDPYIEAERKKVKSLNVAGIVVPIVLYVLLTVFVIAMFAFTGAAFYDYYL